jgi:hypothetical protein
VHSIANELTVYEFLELMIRVACLSRRRTAAAADSPHSDRVRSSESRVYRRLSPCLRSTGCAFSMATLDTEWVLHRDWQHRPALTSLWWAPCCSTHVTTLECHYRGGEYWRQGSRKCCGAMSLDCRKSSDTSVITCSLNSTAAIVAGARYWKRKRLGRSISTHSYSSING